MADRAISALNAASDITTSDLFVMQQGSEAKKVSGQLLVNKLAAFLDGHGGIASITGPVTSGLMDTYTINFADETTAAFIVTNGNGIASLTGPVSSGLGDTYTITFDDGTTQTFTVTNGRGITGITWQSSGTAGDGQTHTGTITYNDGTTSTIVIQDGVKGDTGDPVYTYIRYAAEEPTQDSDMETQPDDWIGIYAGTEDDPTNLSYTDYDWYLIKGATGDPGEDSVITSQVIEYQTSSSGTVIPLGTWTTTIPTVAQGEYLWTRTSLTFNDAVTPIVAYSVGYMGQDGLGAGDMKAVDYDDANAVKTAGGIPDYVTQRLTAHDATLITGQSNISAGDDADQLLLYSANDQGNVKQAKSAFLSGVTSDIAAHKPLRVTTPSFSSLPTTFSAAGVTADMVVAEAVLSNPAAQTGAWTVTTAADSVTISGTISDTTTLTLLLVKPSGDITAS